MEAGSRPTRIPVLRYRQQLDCRRWLQKRAVTLRDSQDRETTILSTRLVSMAERHLASLSWTVIPHNWSGPVEIRSALDGDVENRGVERYRGFESRHIDVTETGSDDQNLWLQARCRDTLLYVAQASRLEARLDGAPVLFSRECIASERSIEERLILECRSGSVLDVRRWHSSPRET